MTRRPPLLLAVVLFAIGIAGAAVTFPAPSGAGERRMLRPYDLPAPGAVRAAAFAAAPAPSEAASVAAVEPAAVVATVVEAETPAPARQVRGAAQSAPESPPAAATSATRAAVSAAGAATDAAPPRASGRPAETGGSVAEAVAEGNRTEGDSLMVRAPSPFPAATTPGKETAPRPPTLAAIPGSTGQSPPGPEFTFDTGVEIPFQGAP